MTSNMNQYVVSIYKYMIGKGDGPNYMRISDVSVSRMYLRWLDLELKGSNTKTKEELKDDLMYIDRQIRAFDRRGD